MNIYTAHYNGIMITGIIADTKGDATRLAIIALGLWKSPFAGRVWVREA